jgi:hypothetical protein
MKVILQSYLKLFTLLVFLFTLASLFRHDSAYTQKTTLYHQIKEQNDIVKDRLESNSIRKVDFANLSYLYGSLSEVKFFKLKNGHKPEIREKDNLIIEQEANLRNVVYGDLTDDGKEDAVVTVSFVSGGSWLPNNIYIYSLKKGKPYLLLLIETGDRANHGYKHLYIDQGSLVLETYSPVQSRGVGQPSKYTKTYYTWDRKRERFLRKNTGELFSIG